MILSAEHIREFGAFLRREEKSTATQEKYLRDVGAFGRYAGGREIEKELVAAWKQELVDRGYAVRSINSMLASVNSLLGFLGLSHCKVRRLRTQRQMYAAEEKELTREEYLRLLAVSKKDERLHLVLQTICSTGIRVSELQFFTVEAVSRGTVTVDCKNKTRTILIPSRLKKLLLGYAKRKKIRAGVIFAGRTGRPLNRSRIWAAMKGLCREAGVQASKVFPHNLRKLFARTFYCLEKDIAKLADVLGHSSIDTTRIYIMTSGTEHRRLIERLGLVVYGNGK